MKLKRDIVKILSLALGLAIGVVLIAKVCFELQYDSYYAHKERVYRIMTGAVRHNEEPLSAGQVSGAVAPGFREFVPGVEAATRVTTVFDRKSYYTEDNNKLTAHLLLADTSFFDIFTREIYSGDPHKVFSEWGKVMVSRSFAQKLGGLEEAVGKTIYNESLPQAKFTVEGVYEDFPRNSTFAAVDILLSVPTYAKNSTENWLGNDRYYGFVKLQEGVDPETLKDAIHAMQEKNQPMEQLEESGLKLWYFLERADKQHLSEKTSRNMVIMLSLVALLLISAACVNYVLNTISSVVQRAKEVGVRKCYGAGNGSIIGLILKEAALNLFVSILLAIALVLALQGTIENLLGAPVASLFNGLSIVAAIAVCTIVLLVSGLIPARIFMGIPVAAAFRNYKETKRRWKLVFLTLQFTFTIFLVCILIIFGRQYNMMLNEDMGYEYDNLLVVFMPGCKSDDFFRVQEELLKRAEVAGCEVMSEIPLNGSSGNNVYLQGAEKELFNIADRYNASEGTAELFGIEYVEGREPVAPKEVAVSRKFVEKMQQFADWSDGAIGKGVIFTGHSQHKDDIYTICGVYEDYKIGAVYADERPSATFGAGQGWKDMTLSFAVVKLSQMNANVIASLQGFLEDLLPDKTLTIASYEEGMLEEFADIRKMKDAVLLGGLFSLIISLMGLIGYIRDEIQRRSSEMAIRKINGAFAREIVAIFIADILKLVLVAAILGVVAAWLAGDTVLQMFPDKTPLSFWIFAAGVASVTVVIRATTVLNCLAAASANPVSSLR